MILVYSILSNIVCDLLVISVEIYYAYLFLGKRKDNSSLPLLYVAVTAIVCLPRLLWGNIFINLLSFFAGAFLISICFNSELVNNIHYAIAMLTINLLTKIIVGYLMRGDYDNPAYDFFVSLVSAFVFLLTSFIAAFLFTDRKLVISIKYSLVLVAIIIVNIGSVYLLIRSGTVSNDIVFFITTAFLITDSLILYIYRSMISKREKEKEILYLSEQNRIYETQIQSGREYEKRIKAIRHDIKNHLSEIYHLAQSDNTTGIKEYIEQLDNELKDATPLISTGVPCFDGIVNYKVAYAKEKGILFSLKTSVPEEFSLSTYDMNIILGNLLDNAIEASANCLASNISIDPIKLEIRYDKSCLIIHVNNTCQSIQKTDSGDYLSTKSNVYDHGIGLKNVRQIVNKYNGSMNINSSNGHFDVMITLFPSVPGNIPSSSSPYTF